MRALRLAALCLLLPATAPAAGGLDIAAPEGAELTGQRSAGHDHYALPVGRFEGDARPVRLIEGQVERRAWRMDDPQATTASVIAFYRRHLSERGFSPVFQCRNRACGGFDFRFGIELMAAPAMVMDTADFAQLSMAAPDGRRASVLASRAFGAVHVQTVMVGGPAGGEAAAPGLGVGAEPTGRPAAAVAADEPPVLATADDAELARLAAAGEPPATASALREALEASGRVVLGGIVFDQGGAALSADSDPALNQVAAMLAAAPDLTVAVVGHSDNVGTLAANIALSRERADAVRNALVARGIDPGRLQAEGAGWLSPRASNATAEGRRQNRRVELVAR